MSKLTLRRTQSSVLRRNSQARPLYVLIVDSDTPSCLFNKIRLDISHYGLSFFLVRFQAFSFKSSEGFFQEGDFHKKRALAEVNCKRD